uniref:Uncharacterized protein n=1 Tax=Magallana gigas TaxID=29159 RepID=A0A8W8MG52_MAGGI
MNNRVRASAQNPIADLNDSDEAEFNSDKVHVVTVEPMNEDEDENVPAETLSPSKGKSSIVPDEEEQLPYWPDIIAPTPEKECFEETEEPLHRPTRVKRRIVSLSSDEDVDTEDVSYRPSVESEEEANTTAPEVNIGNYTPRKRDQGFPYYGRKVKKGNGAPCEYASGLKQKLQETWFYDVPAG